MADVLLAARRLGDEFRDRERQAVSASPGLGAGWRGLQHEDAGGFHCAACLLPSLLRGRAYKVAQASGAPCLGYSSAARGIALLASSRGPDPREPAALGGRQPAKQRARLGPQL